MPKLNLIKFSCYLGASETYLFEINNERNKIDLRLDNVMTIQFTRGFIENIKHLIISSLPNLRHLILSSGYLPSIDNQLSSILNERIQRLDIDIYSKLEPLANQYYVYFSNVEYINFCFNNVETEVERYANVLIKILKNFQNLKTLLIYTNRKIDPLCETKLSKLIEYINMNTIMKIYQVKHFREYALFLKREFNNNEIQDVTSIEGEGEGQGKILLLFK
jgi:hypothetical protein